MRTTASSSIDDRPHVARYFAIRTARGLQARRDRLTHIDTALDHHAVDRCTDLGTRQIDSSGRQLRGTLLHDGLRGAHLSRGKIERRLRAIELGRGDKIARHQLLGALQIAVGDHLRDLGTPHARARRFEIGFGLPDAILKSLWINARNQFAFFTGE